MGIGGCNHEGPRPLPPFSAHATMPCHYVHISNVCTHVYCTAPAPATRRPRTIKNNRDICSQDKPVSFPITSFCRASFVSYRSPAISPKRVTAPTVSRSFFVLIFFSWLRRDTVGSLHCPLDLLGARNGRHPPFSSLLLSAHSLLAARTCHFSSPAALSSEEGAHRGTKHRTRLEDTGPDGAS